jgi:hypothetical protein
MVADSTSSASDSLFWANCILELVRACKHHGTSALLTIKVFACSGEFHAAISMSLRALASSAANSTEIIFRPVAVT